jgi:SAM-dependent methyltransferase
MTEDPDGLPVRPVSPAYTIGYEDEMVTVLQRRTLATCAWFLLPHLRPGLAVLDCGCGPGTMTLEFTARVAPGQVVGLDMAAPQVAAARALAAHRGVVNARFEVSDVYALPFADASFDVVFSHALVSHLAEPMRAFAEMWRVLRPGGVLAVSENDTGTFVVSPAGSAMERFMALYLRVLRHNGGDQLLMRHARGALLATGCTKVEAHASAEVWGLPEATRTVAAGMAAIARGPDFVKPVLAEGWASQVDLDGLVADLPAWGEQMDASMAVLKCGVLGWKPGEAR